MKLIEKGHEHLSLVQILTGLQTFYIGAYRDGNTERQAFN
jgi:hypothetical protein